MQEQVRALEQLQVQVREIEQVEEQAEMATPQLVLELVGQQQQELQQELEQVQGQVQAVAPQGLCLSVPSPGFRLDPESCSYPHSYRRASAEGQIGPRRQQAPWQRMSPAEGGSSRTPSC